ncbi:MAG: 1-acyl-sn-glycerol-3-phosphate acyltransferase [Terriglobia bacterium]
METLTGESSLYNFFRRGLRLWFGLIFHRLRVLDEISMPASGPALLVVNHPPGLAEALLLVAALGRRVHCLIDQDHVESPLGRLAAGALGMIPYQFRNDDWPAVLESVCRIFSHGGTVLIFARQHEAGAAEGFAPEAAEVALEAEIYLGREAPLPIVPVHLFLPVPPSGAGEALVHIEPPLASQGASWRKEEDLDAGIRLLDQEIEKACCESPFRLQPDVVEKFLGGLESVMREDFAEKWSHRANWKQRVEDFDLSPFLVKLTHQLNYGHPGRLAALNGALQGYQERKRRAALHAFIGETAGAWHKSQRKKMCVWAETIIGFPIACYGLLNLLIAWFVIWAVGLWKKGLWEATPREWTKRVVIALVCYAGQIGLAAHYLSRAEAGYYAPSLLISGAYLLRYLWLLERRTSVLNSATGNRRRTAKLRRLRTALIDELKRDQDRYTTTWKIAH